jgi:hypothetical protein
VFFKPDKNISRRETSMAKAKKGDVFSCETCGLVVVVDEACGCDAAEIVCCEEPMNKGKAAANKVKQKAVQAAAAKPAARTVKAKTVAKAVKPAPKSKPAVAQPAAAAKKPAAKKPPARASK